MAYVALALMLFFTVGWIIYLSPAGGRHPGLLAALLFSGGFGVLMFIGIKLYDRQGLDVNAKPAPPQDGGEKAADGDGADREPSENDKQ